VQKKIPITFGEIMVVLTQGVREHFGQSKNRGKGVDVVAGVAESGENLINDG
jgi:hypothetical protein